MSETITSIRELGLMLRSGDISHLNGKIIIDLSNIDTKDFDTLIKIAKFKAFKTEMVENPIDLAKEYNNNSEYEKTLSLLTANIINELNNSYSKAMAWALCAEANLEIGNYSAATQNTELALNFARSNGSKDIEFLSYLIICKNLVLQNRISEAKIIWTQAYNLVKEVKNPEWIVSLLRSLANIQFYDNSSNCLNTLLMSRRMSLNLNQESTAKSCLLELCIMERKFGKNDLFVESKNEINEIRLNNSNNRIKKLIDILDNNSSDLEQLCHSDRVLISHSNKPIQGSEVLKLADVMNTKWAYDSKCGLIFDFTNNSYDFIANESPLTKLVLLLNQTEKAIPMPEAFQTVWNTQWMPARHENTVKVSIGRIGRMAPSVKIRRKQKALALETKGIII